MSEAKKLLQASRWFHDASDGMLDALAAKMVKQEVGDGHVFQVEGTVVTNLILLESGKLQRTKISAEGASLEEEKKGHAKRRSSMSIRSNSVVVDTIQGRGRITGLLHTIREEAPAFATVSAMEESTVWLLPAQDLRSIITSNPEYSLQFMHALANELRTGSKSFRGLLAQLQGVSLCEEQAGGAPVCRIMCYDSTSWVTEGFKPAIEKFNKEYEGQLKIVMDFTTDRLSEQTSIFAAGYDGVCLFVNDSANAEVLQRLSHLGAKMVAMRCAGFDRVDTKAARAYGMTVARVPAYSPYAVAEMGISLLMAVNRKITKANNRVRMANFTLDAGLMGMDIYGKTVGVMGTGKIGALLCNIVLGFGAKLICYDVFENEELKQKGATYVSKDEIFAQSDVLFLMMPLIPPTHHTINDEALTKLKKGVILINTSRGGLVDTKALLKGLRTGVIGGVGMDVYENEQEYFFQDWSARNVKDTDLLELLGNNKVILTAHQAFFTKEAVGAIVQTTIDNIRDYKLKGLVGQKHPNNCIPALKD